MKPLSTVNRRLGIGVPTIKDVLELAKLRHSSGTLLFILALEVLACQIRESDKVTGIVVNNEKIKLNLFADDMTRFLSDTTAYQSLIETLQLFQH